MSKTAITIRNNHRKRKNRFRLALSIVSFFLSLYTGFAAVHTSVSNGDWSAGSTWDSGTAPSCGDTIIISSGTTVSVNSMIYLDACGLPTFILIEGTLRFASGKKMYLTANSGVTVTSGGQILAGSGGGKGANVIEIDGAPVWNSSDGDITQPTTFGTEFGIEIKSIASGDFNTASTWDCNCVPDSTNVATILSGNVVTISSQSSIFDIIINGSLEIQGEEELYVKNSWQNNGSFISNNSTVSFGGSGTRSLAGIRDQEFYNLNIKNGCVLNNNAGLLNLRGIMSFDDGAFASNDSLFLISDQDGTGAIGTLSSGSFTGNVFSNRYVMSGATGWRFLTSCIQGSTLEDIDDDIITAGVPGSDYPNFSFVSVYDYDETVPGHKDSGFVVPSSMSESIAAGKGFWIYAGDNLAGTAAFNIDFYGAINTGAINLPVTYTNSGNTGDGWNLVANPYPCSIDWDDANWVKTNISDETHIFNPNTGTYAVYAAGVGANGGSSVIASNQAFWVKATATSPQLTANEDCKVSTNADPFKSFIQPEVLKIYSKKTSGSSFSDEIVLVFNPEENDSKVMATKLLSTKDSVLNIMFNTDNSASSIYGLSNQFDTIPLKLMGNSQNVVLSFKDGGFLNNFWSVYLLDVSNNTKYPITEDISFDMPKSFSTANSDFALIVVPKIKLSGKQPTCKFSDNGSIVTNAKNMDEFMCLTKSSNPYIIAPENGKWTNLTEGEYSIHIKHPIDGTLSKDSSFLLTPDVIGVHVVESEVLYTPQELVLSESFLSNEWLVNGQSALLNNGSFPKEQLSSQTEDHDVTLVQCIYVDSKGCKNLYSWAIYNNGEELVFPNPYKNGGPLSILMAAGNHSIEIINLEGQIVWSRELYSESSGFHRIHDLNLAKGQYLMTISGTNSVKNVKLVINE